MKHYMKKWTLFQQLGLQEDTTMYVVVKWFGHTEPIKDERIPKKCSENVGWRAGCFGNWGKKGKKEKEKRLTLRYDSKTKTRCNMKSEVGNCVRGL